MMAAILCWAIEGLCSEGLEWERFRLRPEIWMGEAYSDNVFLTRDDCKGDFFTHVLPKAALDVAIAPRHYVSVAYEGDYQFHSRFDNFREFQHRGDMMWRLDTAKGSSFEAGAWIKDGAVQPYSEQGFSKDYTQWEAYTDNLFQVQQFTELGLAYRHNSRRFSDELYKIDDFDRDTVSLDVVYDRLWHLPLLLEYRFDRQTNRDVAGLLSRDSVTNSLFAGARWKPGAHLSGILRFGYAHSAFEDTDDFNGFVMDSELTYQLTDATQFRLTLTRLVNTSTRAERETGFYYVGTGGTLSATYTRLDPLTLMLEVGYMNRAYDQYSFEGDREDNYYRAGFTARYELFQWAAISLEYNYRRNDTDYLPAEYTENRVELRMKFSL